MPQLPAARIADLVKRDTLDLSAVRFFVLDEADRLVDQDGLATVEQLFQALPKGGAGTSRLQARACAQPCMCAAVQWASAGLVTVRGTLPAVGRVHDAACLVAPPAHPVWLGCSCCFWPCFTAGGSVPARPPRQHSTPRLRPAA